ncbi:AcrR family transcriptional regulator [Pelomonas saccharophila]|uniref:AcrR family transcriptional regulator n=1 Tax=Roseateles saccharophilus TaxID=304 RepID=A0ABU1YGB9_ROSSA|nr:helix-turn-helix domain-containing protein [Roseateles saccharophilus]MDR7267887.1 AcrR family transcriptional regulator [Roseateles saccharophilus]
MSTLRPRKQPTQPRAIETVACILEAAAQILEAQGFEAFNTNAVAERAGVSIGSLYQYFPGKDALLIALMEREKQRFRDDAAAALAEPSGRTALRHLIQAAVRQQLDRAELARLLDLEEEKPETRQVLEGKSGFAGLIRRILEMPGLPLQPDVAGAADDVGQLIRALTDAAGLRGDSDAAALEKRIAAAVFGYLGAAQM